ncbi:Uncharacterized protein DAT39_003109, partial [Clarias magur]
MDAAGDLNIREALMSHARVLNELRQDVAQIRMDMVQIQQNFEKMQQVVDQLTNKVSACAAPPTPGISITAAPNPVMVSRKTGPDRTKKAVKRTVSYPHPPPKYLKPQP